MKTVRRNATRKLEAIWTNAHSGNRYELYHNFIPQPTSTDAIRKEYEETSFAKLTDNEDGTFTLHIHSNLWYKFSDSRVIEEPAQEQEDNEAIEEFEIINDPEQLGEVKIVKVQADDQRFKTKQPRLNKQDWIDDYLKQLDDEDQYYVRNCKVTHVAKMTAEQYDIFTYSLLSDYDWLAGLGGSGTDADLRDVADFAEYTEKEQDEWRKHAYDLAIQVEAPERQTIFVDPQGYRYARYVYFPINGTYQETSVEDTPNPVIALTKALLQTKDSGYVLNTLINSGMEPIKALDVMEQAIA